MRLINSLKIARAFLGRARPIILYHKPTSKCDCRCRFCDFWKQRSVDEKILSTDKVFTLLDFARAAGMTHYTLWGGEPLLVDDLPGWLEYAHRRGFYTSLCTSGYHLTDQALHIAPYLDRLLLSLEFADERQDDIRRKPGLFKNIVAGLKRFKAASTGEIVLWSNINRLNMGNVGDIARFAQDYKIGVEFFPMAHFPSYNQNLLIDAAEKRDVFDRIKELKRQGYPVYNTRYALELMASSRPFRCNAARLSVQVFPDGSLYGCEPRIIPDLAAFGTIETVNLSHLASTSMYKKTYKQLASCNKCLLPCVANMADNLILQPVYLLQKNFFRKKSKSSDKNP